MLLCFRERCWEMESQVQTALSVLISLTRFKNRSSWAELVAARTTFFFFFFLPIETVSIDCLLAAQSDRWFLLKWERQLKRQEEAISLICNHASSLQRCCRAQLQRSQPEFFLIVMCHFHKLRWGTFLVWAFNFLFHPLVQITAALLSTSRGQVLFHFTAVDVIHRPNWMTWCCTALYGVLFGCLLATCAPASSDLCQMFASAQVHRKWREKCYLGNNATK